MELFEQSNSLVSQSHLLITPIMGNWRTVKLEGSCDLADLDELRKACTVDAQYSNYHCLSFGTGLCGLGEWAGTYISAEGNLFERDYSIGDVEAQLLLLAKVAPSLRLYVHCGGENESKDVVATLLLEDGVVEVREPMISKLSGASDEQMSSRLYGILSRGFSS